MLAPLLAATALLGAHSTSYCLHGTMADGSYTRAGSAASNRHPLGTVLTLHRPGPGGRRVWTVRDRIGWGSELDFWQPTCAAALAWGRRYVRYGLGRVRLRARVLRVEPVRGGPSGA